MDSATKLFFNWKVFNLNLLEKTPTVFSQGSTYEEVELSMSIHDTKLVCPLRKVTFHLFQKVEWNLISHATFQLQKAILLAIVIISFLHVLLMNN